MKLKACVFCMNLCHCHIHNLCSAALTPYFTNALMVLSRTGEREREKDRGDEVAQLEERWTQDPKDQRIESRQEHKKNL